VRRIGLAALLFVLALGAVPAPAQDEQTSEATVSIEVDPREATVGQHLAVNLVVTLGPDFEFEPPILASEIGPFSVLSGSWSPSVAFEAGSRRTWSGVLSAYRTGELELPAIRLTVSDESGNRTLSTEPVSVTIGSVLVEDADAEIADLKPPASVPPDFSAVRAAIVVLAVLLLAALLAWWLHRRYAARLQAAHVPDDPFHRIAPDVWVYSELQKLLEDRFPERGEIDRFYRELARILKAYLSGRYRVDLLEQTSFEVPESLRQAGAEEPPIEETSQVLGRCDQVKFARIQPGPDDWKSVVEDVYRIVDRTKTVGASDRPNAEAV